MCVGFMQRTALQWHCSNACNVQDVEVVVVMVMVVQMMPPIFDINKQLSAMLLALSGRQATSTPATVSSHRPLVVFHQSEKHCLVDR
jgi:hypothetical protein